MPTPRALAWLRRRFVTGFFYAVPLIISVAALLWIFDVLDSLTGPVYARLLGREVPGLGLATTAAFVLLVGVVGNNVLGKRLVQQGEALLQKIPVFRTIYSPIRQLLAAFSPDNESSLKRVVMVRDGCGGFRLGFVTRDFVAERDGRLQALVAVYIPTNNLYLGDILVCDRDAVVYPDITVQEGVRVFLTGGMAIPETLVLRAAGEDARAAIQQL
jgi:uncharacterized membrane protein